MSIDLNQLQSDFQSAFNQLLISCDAQNIQMSPYFGIRNPLEQARLWRQSRNSTEINSKIAELRSKGAAFLADCIELVGPQHGKPVTNAIPGLSWHQWGEAVDSVWVVNGRSEWSASKKIDGKNGYQVYAAEAEKLGLTAGGLWKSLKDWPHVQLRKASSPLAFFKIQQINERMKELYSSHFSDIESSVSTL